MSTETIDLNHHAAVEVPFEAPEESTTRVFGNVIPRRRDSKGNPIPRTHWFLRPLVSLDPDALRDTAEAFLRSPEAGLRYLPWLKARNAIAVDENIRAIRSEMVANRNAANQRTATELGHLRPKLDAAQAAEALARQEAVRSLDGLPLAFRPDASILDFAADEPATLSELAGEMGLPTPELSVGWWVKTGYKLLSAIGGGLVFGISFGLLTQKIELASLAEEWPLIVVFGVIGVVVMTIVGAILPPLGKRVGSWLYHKGASLSWVSTAIFFSSLTFLAGLIALLITIESKVEQLGIFNGLASDSSLHAATVSQSDLFWVSLMLVVPVVFCYLTLGLAEGERTGNIDRLRSLLAARRASIRTSPSFSAAAIAHQALVSARGRVSELSDRIARLESSLRYEFSRDELDRLEDCEMDAAAHSWTTEDVMFKVARGVRARPASRSASHSRLRKREGFWRGLLALFARRH